MEEEWPLLKDNLERDRHPLSWIVVSNKNGRQTSYDILNKSLETIKASLVNLFHQAHLTESPTQEDLQITLLKQNWENLVLQIHNEVTNLEEVLLNFEVRSWQLEEEYSYTLIVQVFQILNWLKQNKLFEKKFFEEWIHKKPIWELLMNHIADVSGDKRFLDLDLRERLIKSKSTEHLSTVFGLLRKSSWRDVEFKCLQRKILFAKQVPYEDRPIPEVMDVAKDFDIFGIESTDSAQDEKKIENVKRLIHLINNLELGNLGRHMYLTCGILYDLISFLSKYHTELFKAAFENSKRAHNLSLKLYVLDSIIQWLKSARDVQFIGLHGLWTTELELKDPDHGISIFNSSDLQNLQNIDSSHFNDISDCYLEKDFDKQREMFNALSLQRAVKRSRNSVCINSRYQYKDLPDVFGTNFELSTGVMRASMQEGHTTSLEKRFSRLFIIEVYTWIENLKFVLEEFKRRQMVFEKTVKIMLDENEDPIPEFFKKWLKDSSFPEMVSEKIMKSIGDDKENKLNFKDWIIHSIIPRGIYQEIVKCLSIVQDSWNKIEEKLQLLNGYILLSIHETPPIQNPEDSLDFNWEEFLTGPSKRVKYEKYEAQNLTSCDQLPAGLKIPDLILRALIPFSYADWLKKLIES